MAKTFVAVAAILAVCCAVVTSAISPRKSFFILSKRFFSIQILCHLFFYLTTGRVYFQRCDVDRVFSECLKPFLNPYLYIRGPFLDLCDLEHNLPWSRKEVELSANYKPIRGDVKIRCSLPLLAASGCYGVTAFCRQLK